MEQTEIILLSITAIMLAVIGLCIIWTRKDNRNKKELLKQHDAIYSTNLLHQIGLPLDTETRWMVFLCENEFIFEYEDKRFQRQNVKLTLPFEKILDIGTDTKSTRGHDGTSYDI